MLASDSVDSPDSPWPMEQPMAATSEPADPTDIRAQQRQARQTRQAQAAQRRRRIQRLRAVLELPQGRAFVRDLLERAGVFQLSYTPGDALAGAFREGGRNLGLQLIADINKTGADALAQLLTEQDHE